MSDFLTWAANMALNVNETGLAVLGGIAVLSTLLALGHALTPSDPMASRVRNHLRRRERLRTDRLRPRRNTAQFRRAQMGLLRELLNRLKLLSGTEARRSGDLLAQAGWRTRDALTIFMGLRIGMPFVTGFTTLFVLLPEESMSTMVRMVGALVGTVFGAYLPMLGVKHMIGRRQGMLRKQLPDALDLLVICAEAGLSLDAALGRVARELGNAAPHIADELGLTAIELGFLPNRRQALNNLAKRTGLASIRGVVNTLLQTERYGTPLAQSLRVLAAEFRDDRMMRAEEKAARLPAILTVPMILFILPTLFVVLIGPAIIQVMENFK